MYLSIFVDRYDLFATGQLCIKGIASFFRLFESVVSSN